MKIGFLLDKFGVAAIFYTVSYRKIMKRSEFVVSFENWRLIIEDVVTAAVALIVFCLS